MHKLTLFKLLKINYYLHVLHFSFLAGNASHLSNQRKRWNSCSSENVFLRLMNIDLRNCVKECISRKTCIEINYWRVGHACDLRSTVNIEVEDHKTPFCVSMKKVDIGTASLMAGSCTNCKETEVCESESQNCETKECPPLGDNNGHVFGNMQNIGANILANCTDVDGLVQVQHFKQITCNRTGRWSEECQIAQWVETVIDFSSEYASTRWSANQIIGTPDTYPRYGDIDTSWATLVIDAYQFIEVGFATAVYIEGVHIYETFHAGGTKRISAMDNNRVEHVLWQTDTVTVIQESRIFSPTIQTDFKSSVLRVYIDCSIANTWVEIDAVLLLGRLW